jgi:hypothetical protein
MAPYRAGQVRTSVNPDGRGTLRGRATRDLVYSFDDVQPTIRFRRPNNVSTPCRPARVIVLGDRRLRYQARADVGIAAETVTLWGRASYRVDNKVHMTFTIDRENVSAAARLSASKAHACVRTPSQP